MNNQTTNQYRRQQKPQSMKARLMQTRQNLMYQYLTK